MQPGSFLEQMNGQFSSPQPELPRHRIFKGILLSGNLKRNINNIISFVEHEIIDLSSLPVHVLRRLCCFKKLNPQSLLIASELPRALIPTAPFLYLNRKKL